jgi:hypothetical protein
MLKRHDIPFVAVENVVAGDRGARGRRRNLLGQCTRREFLMRCGVAGRALVVTPKMSTRPGGIVQSGAISAAIHHRGAGARRRPRHRTQARRNDAIPKRSKQPAIASVRRYRRAHGLVIA